MIDYSLLSLLLVVFFYLYQKISMIPLMVRSKIIWNLFLQVSTTGLHNVLICNASSLFLFLLILATYLFFPVLSLAEYRNLNFFKYFCTFLLHLFLVIFSLYTFSTIGRQRHVIRVHFIFFLKTCHLLSRNVI